MLLAPPGAGKTTRVPGALLDATGGDGGQVVVLEPRRLAARAAARRVASERGAVLGKEVGYHVRFDRKASPRTRILFMTEGMFLARLQDDPFLEGVTAVVFDEFHERSLDVDLALAMTARIRREVRDDLRIVVMSATLDPGPVARFLGDAPVVVSEGRTYPVETSFMAREGQERPEEHVARGVRAALEGGDGDVLVFLAGAGEIRRVQKRLGSPSGARVLPLYGDLSPAEQDAALSRGPTRRVVLATNVAESSVTVEGVSAVVDSGEARVLRHDAGAGIDRLRVERIDRAAADQRRGRAGRLGPGRCIRLWSAIDDRGLEAAIEPEIRRLDLAGVLLSLLNWGERDPRAFEWLEPPPAHAIAAGEELLAALGATDGQGRLTAHGRRIARLPLHPRLATLCLAAARMGDAPGGALAAALLSERDPFLRDAPGGGGHARDATDSDVAERCAVLEAFGRSGSTGYGPLTLSPPGARNVLRIRDAILRALGRVEVDRDGDGAPLRRALAEAFADRLCIRREPGSPRARMVGGKGVQIARSSGVTEADLFVAVRCTSAFRANDEDLVRLASAVDPEWIDGGERRVSLRPVFDPRTRRVVGKRREMLGPLVLTESDHPLGGSSEVEEVLLEAARAEPRVALGIADDDPTLERLRFLHENAPELGLAPPTDAELVQTLEMLVPGCRSYGDLAKKRPVETFMMGLDHGRRVRFESEAPTTIQVPSGSRIRLRYQGAGPPVLAVRIQEMFGCAETPTVAGGRVRVLLHLLAPNGRPQQITDDLAGFWERTYAQVRKDLRGRYPKHPWPEEPLSAAPVSPRRRRRRR